jgi:metal-responsive CopG/Arc/MetJ family transcriptional regulator
MIMVKGKAEDIQRLADDMQRQRGVLHAKLAMSSTGKTLA